MKIKDFVNVLFLAAMVIFIVACQVQTPATDTGNEEADQELIIVPDEGYLKVESNPSEADIYIGSELVGKTPTTLTLQTGAATLKLKKQDYQDYFATVNVQKGQRTDIQIDLVPVVNENATPAKGWGYLLVTSTPADAKIYVDGGIQGSTNINITGVKAGIRTVRLTKRNYEDYTATVNVVAGQTAKLDARLIPSAPTYIRLNATLDNKTMAANFYLWDETWTSLVLDGQTPFAMADIKAGTYGLNISRPGYIEYAQTIVVEPSKETVITFELKKK